MKKAKGRIENRLRTLAAKKEKALALFVTAGYPELHSTVDLVLAMERGGADIIEIGMPFSDPLADGPVIQQSSSVAIRNGMTLARLLEDVSHLRSLSDIPVVLMGYLNPIFRFGPDEFFAAAARSGVDGVVLPELPLEESERFAPILMRNSLSQILLVTPTTEPARIQAVDDACSGFLYCVSTTGVTGGEGRKPGAAYVRDVKRSAHRNPVLVGFGIASPDDARMLAQDADGVIIGSALIKQIAAGVPPALLTKWVSGFKAALRQG